MLAAAVLVAVTMLTAVGTADVRAEGTAAPPAASSMPCRDEDIIGWGRGTTGGSEGQAVVVSTPDEFLTVVAEWSRPLTVVIDVPEPEVWTLGRINIDAGDLTIVGDPDVIIRGSQFLVRASDVILRSLYVGTGDETLSRAEAADFDPFTINGSTLPVANVVLQCVVGIWGPDIGGLAILGNVSDVTVQDSIFGEGLYLSRHPEATPRRDGHSHGVNLSILEPDLMLERISLARNLIARSEGRMPKVTGGRSIEVVNNLIVGWGSRSPEGNAESIHVIGNYLIPSDKSTELLVWSPRLQDVDTGLYPDSVWLSGNVLEGHGGDELRGPPRRVYRDTEAFPPTVEALSAMDARAHVLQFAGGPQRPAWAQRVIDDVLAGVGEWYNGTGEAAPNPSW